MTMEPELLKIAAAAFALHGDSRVYFVVHQVDSDNRTIDHNEFPVTTHIGRHLGSIKGPQGHFAFSLFYGHSGESAVTEWLAIAKQCGAWLMANRGTNVSPLPGPECLWAIELLQLPEHCREYIKTVWYCNAFAGTVEAIRRLTAKPAAASEPQGTGKGDGDPLAAIPDEAMMNHIDLAAKLNLEVEPLRKRLDRWRERNLDGWKETENRQSRDPKYIYRVAAIRGVLREALASA